MKKKILLVDDKSTIGKVAGVYLGKEYDFTYLEDPIKAIEWLNEGNVPDLIISDIRMPLMMGKVQRKESDYWKKEQKTIS